MEKYDGGTGSGGAFDMPDEDGEGLPPITSGNAAAAIVKTSTLAARVRAQTDNTANNGFSLHCPAMAPVRVGAAAPYDSSCPPSYPTSFLLAGHQFAC